MKKFNSYKDIVVKWNDNRSKWQLDLRPLGVKPARPFFESKSKASEAAKKAFDKWEFKQGLLRLDQSSRGVEVSDVPDHSNTTVGEMNDKLPRLLTTEQACEYLWGKGGRSNASRLYRAHDAGKIKSTRLSGRHFWPLPLLKSLCGEE